MPLKHLETKTTGIFLSMIFFKLGSTCGGRFPAPRASITKPLALLVSLAMNQKVHYPYQRMPLINTHDLRHL